MFEFAALGPAILAFGLVDAIAFWAVCFVIFVLICFDQGAISLGVLAAAALASYWIGLWGTDLFLLHQKAVLWFLVFYVPIGLGWATLKWWFYCSKLARKVRDYLAERQAQLVKAGGTPEDVTSKMAEYRSSLWRQFETLPPVVGNHKSDLIRWMGWWPFSVLASIFSDVIREVFDWLYEKLGKIWQKISDHAFRNIQYDNPPAE